MIQLFNEKRGQVFNVNTLVTHRLQTLEAKLTSLLSSIAAIPGTELALHLPATNQNYTQERFLAHGGTECNTTDNPRDSEGSG